MTLEQQITEAAMSGRLTGLALWPEKSGGRWQANVRVAGSTGWSVVIDADPVTALKRALVSAAPIAKNEGIFD